jgi:hypothetical protein
METTSKLPRTLPFPKEPVFLVHVEPSKRLLEARDAHESARERFFEALEVLEGAEQYHVLVEQAEYAQREADHHKALAKISSYLAAVDAGLVGGGAAAGGGAGAAAGGGAGAAAGGGAGGAAGETAAEKAIRKKARQDIMAQKNILAMDAMRAELLALVKTQAATQPAPPPAGEGGAGGSGGSA